jgi:hypothetical protein
MEENWQAWIDSCIKPYQQHADERRISTICSIDNPVALERIRVQYLFQGNKTQAAVSEFCNAVANRPAENMMMMNIIADFDRVSAATSSGSSPSLSSQKEKSDDTVSTNSRNSTTVPNKSLLQRMQQLAHEARLQQHKEHKEAALASDEFRDHMIVANEKAKKAAAAAAAAPKTMHQNIVLFYNQPTQVLAYPDLLHLDWYIKPSLLWMIGELRFCVPPELSETNKRFMKDVVLDNIRGYNGGAPSSIESSVMSVISQRETDITISKTCSMLMAAAAERLTCEWSLGARDTIAILRDRGATADVMEIDDLMCLVLYLGASLDDLVYGLSLKYHKLQEMIGALYSPITDPSNKRTIRFFSMLRCNYLDILKKCCMFQEIQDLDSLSNPAPDQYNIALSPPSSSSHTSQKIIRMHFLKENEVNWRVCWKRLWDLQIDSVGLSVLGCTAEQLIDKQSFYYLCDLNYIPFEELTKRDGFALSYRLMRHIPGIDIHQYCLKEMNWTEFQCSQFASQNSSNRY